MSQVPRASPTNLEQTARSVNVLRDLLQRHLRTPDAMPSVSTGLTEAQVQAMIRRALEQFEIQQDVFPVLQLANATYGGSQFFYTSHDDGTGAGYVANRFYIDSEEGAASFVTIFPATISKSGNAALIVLTALITPWLCP